MEDERIIQLYWERSQDAIRASERKYGTYCHAIAWNILYRREDSEECVNDTWLAAWDSMPPHHPSCLKVFLGKITRNLALNRYEKTKAQKRGGGQIELCLEELAECLSGKHPQEEMVDQMVLTQCLNRFLESLKPEERKIFVRRYWYLSSVKEIAKANHCSESKIKMSLLRTRNKLKEALEKEGISV